MRSSLVVTLRALVMMGFLITMPLVALWDTPLRELAGTMIQRAMGQRFDQSSAASGQPPLQAGQVGPQYEPMADRAPASPGDLAATTPIARPGAGASSARRSVAGSAGAASSGPRPKPGTTSSVPGELAPVHSAPARQSPQPHGRPTDRFGDIQRRLRELRATYWLLETWGTSSQTYRFHCKIAVAERPDYARHFEATDRDPLVAMERVLMAVEAWRAGRWR